MMQYTSVLTYGDYILYRGIENEKRRMGKIKYRPSLFVSCPKESQYKSINEKNLAKMDFESINEAKDFIKQYKDVDNFEIYGNQSYEYAYIADLFPTEIDWNIENIIVSNIDIEVGSENGFPAVETATEALQAITIRKMGKTYAFGCKPYSAPIDVSYIQCDDELDLIEQFLIFWESDYPDVVTGWFCIPKDGYVWTNDCIKEIQNISVGEIIEEGKIVKNKSPITLKQSYVINTQLGNFETSLEHKIPYLRVKKGKYTNFSERKKSYEKCEGPLSDLISDMNNYNLFVYKPIHINKNIGLDITNEEAYILGLIYTDGTISWGPNYRFRLYNTDMGVLDRFESICNVRNKRIGSQTPKQNYAYTCYFNDNDRYNNLFKLIHNGKRKELDLEQLSKLSYCQFLYFYAGIVDGDGCAAQNAITSCDFTENGINVISNLLNWNGIIHSVYKNSVRICNVYNNQSFINILPIYHSERKEKISNFTNTDQHMKNTSSNKIRYRELDKNTLVVKVNSIIPGKIKEMLDIETETGYFIANGFKVHNCKLFDIPYLVNRITNLCGESTAKRLSPWGHIRSREIKFGKKTSISYSLFGISTLDYIELYKKFAPYGQSRESYKLDFICNIEIGETKLSYEEYGNLYTLYKRNFQLFMDYNVRDTKLVELLDNKLKLLLLAFKLAYHAKCNFDDVFMQTRMWDCLVFNHLLDENVVVPAKQSFDKDEYEGAWVKEPIPGLYKWVVSFDFTSLYPKRMMQDNLSNDTLFERKEWPSDIINFMAQDINVENLLNKKIDTSILKKYNLVLTPNKQLFKKNKEGFLPKIVRKMFNDRVLYKNRMKKAEKELQKTSDPIEIAKLKNEIAMNDTFQQAIKVCINSCYGALGNQFFRLFDVRIAEAVTTGGQLAIHWVIKGINEYLNKLLGTNIDYVIAADTDSMYLCLDKLIEKVYGKDIQDTSKILDFLDKVCKEKLSIYIDQCCQDLKDYTNAFSQEMEMKREKLCDVSVIVAKKRYIWNVWDNEGLRYNKPKISIVGLETKRSNVPEWAKNKLTEAIGYILEGNQSKVHELVKKARIEFSELSIEDLASPTGMNGLEDYTDKETLYKKGAPVHVKGSIIYNEFLERKGLTKKYPKIKEGEKVKYVYLKFPNPIHHAVIAFSNKLPPEFNLNLYIDYDMMFSKIFLDPLTNILKVIGWSNEPKRSLF